MDAAITCALAIDGEQVADSATDWGDAPVALDALAITWGRDSAMDQPKAATCTARVACPSDDVDDLLTRAVPGAPLTVTAAYTAPPDDVSMVDAGPATLTVPGALHLPPGDLQNADQAPDAWDDLPRITEAAHLATTATLDLPPSTTATLALVTYTGPWESAATVGPDIATADGPGTVTLSGAIAAPAAAVGAWAGLRVQISGGATWADATATWEAATGTWADYAHADLTAATLARRDAAAYEAAPFAGRITDVSAAWSEDAGCPVVTLTAADILTELANRYIGEEPWPQESATERLDRIIAATGLDLATIIDPAPAATTIAAQDVDRRATADLLDDLATSTGAILWPTTHATTGPYLRLEDPTRRVALYQLTVPASGPVSVDVAQADALPLPASVLDRADVTITKGVTEVSSAATVRWREAGTDNDGKPTTTDREYQTTDTGRLASYGYRALSVSTSLTSEADAADLAAHLMARAAPSAWMIPTARWDTEREHTDPLAALATLDATRRLGRAVIITGVAPWIPGSPDVPAYLDGGTCTYTGGRWVLDLTLTKAAGEARSITWDQMPRAVTWERVPLTWTDLGAAHL